ncbi:hypothetical protein LCGC14_2667710 [marine sediment metagenome]|uniref:Uncharacterized protein n=1 Tax=marine sediment metagenome TaxID=412755 RepID=A0A0F9C057_9ZZZZ
MLLTPLQKYKKDLRAACQTANVSDWFERYINKSHGMGNTDTLIYASKMRGATLITHTEKSADEIAEAHKVKTVRVGESSFAIQPTRSVVDNAAILLLVRESRRIQMLAEQLLSLMDVKGMD